MVSALLCVTDGKVGGALTAAMRTLAAKLSEEEWRIRDCRDPALCEKLLADGEAVDLMCCDLTGKEWLDALPVLRMFCKTAKLMILANEKVPVQAYLRPQIMPTSLLLKPFDDKQLHGVMEEFIRSFTGESGEEKRLMLKTREGRVFLPYDRILYLEAREKKICARMRDEEYVFYHTIDKLQEELPDVFVRTHRSYLVNREMIEQIRVSEGLVTLRYGFAIPLSRKYRQQMKELSL